MLAIKRSKIESSSLNWDGISHLKGRRWYALRKGPWKYVQTDSSEEFLFDIGKDPYETNDLKDLHPETFKQMKARTL